MNETKVKYMYISGKDEFNSLINDIDKAHQLWINGVCEECAQSCEATYFYDPLFREVYCKHRLPNQEIDKNKLYYYEVNKEEFLEKYNGLEKLWYKGICSECDDKNGFFYFDNFINGIYCIHNLFDKVKYFFKEINNNLYKIPIEMAEYADRVGENITENISWSQHINDNFFKINEREPGDKIIKYGEYEENYTHFNQVFYDLLNQCGCGDPKSRWEFIRKILKLYEDNKDYTKIKSITTERVVELIKNINPEVVAEYIICTLEDTLLEHSSSVRFNWLTDLGKVMKDIKYPGEDYLDKGKYYIITPLDQIETGISGTCGWHWICHNCGKEFCSGCNNICPNCGSNKINAWNLEKDELHELLQCKWRIRESTVNFDKITIINKENKSFANGHINVMKLDDNHHDTDKQVIYCDIKVGDQDTLIFDHSTQKDKNTNKKEVKKYKHFNVYINTLKGKIKNFFIKLLFKEYLITYHIEMEFPIEQTTKYDDWILEKEEKK